jgi:hypothetical protein
MSRGEVTFLFHTTDKNEEPVKCTFFERFPDPQDEMQIQQIIIDNLLELLDVHKCTGNLKCITAVVDIEDLDVYYTAMFMPPEEDAQWAIHKMSQTIH